MDRQRTIFHLSTKLNKRVLIFLRLSISQISWISLGSPGRWGWERYFSLYDSTCFPHLTNYHTRAPPVENNQHIHCVRHPTVTCVHTEIWETLFWFSIFSTGLNTIQFRYSGSWLDWLVLALRTYMSKGFGFSI